MYTTTYHGAGYDSDGSTGPDCTTLRAARSAAGQLGNLDQSLRVHDATGQCVAVYRPAVQRDRRGRTVWRIVRCEPLADQTDRALAEKEV